MGTNEKESSSRDLAASQKDTDKAIENDQDRDPPRTAVPPDSPTTPGQPTSDDPNRDPDSDPPRTPVFPQR